jgi:hypothetical protein
VQPAVQSPVIPASDCGHNLSRLLQIFELWVS